MGNYNDAVVADLQCRFSEGEVVTWEEFYKWIGDIEDGFNSHAHDGTSGGGPVLSIDDMSGIVALKARVTALEGAGYATQGYVDTAVTDMATQTWVGLEGFATEAYVGAQGFATEAWVGLEGFATEAWVALNYYNKTKYDSDLGTVAASIIDNLGLIGDNADAIDAVEADMVIANQGISDAASAISALDGRISGIENDYETQTAANSAHFSLQTEINTNIYAIGDNEDDISALDSRLYTAEGAISDNESDISGNAGDISDNASGISDNEGDISGIDTVISELWDNAEAHDLEISANKSNISTNEGDISDLDDRVTDLENA